MSETLPSEPRLPKPRMALIGGAGAGFIGRVHYLAATLEGRAQLVAGALSSDPDRAQRAAEQFRIPPERSFPHWRELIRIEADRTVDRPDFVTIATPNHTHFEIAKAALEAGFNVVCEKPMTTRLAEARQLVQLVERTGAVFALMHNYSGYPMVRQARAMIAEGQLGRVQAVRCHYIQGWLCGLQPGTVPARGAWKADPAKAGPSGALGDIGTHAFHLIRFVTGLAPREVFCQLAMLHGDRPLDDYGHVILRFAGDVLGSITVSQVTHGRLNDLQLEVDGTEGSLSWRQEEPNQLVLRRFNQPVQIYERNSRASYMLEPARAATRLPGGHPEAFLEAFANVYRDALDDIQQRRSDRPVVRRDTVYPNVYDGLEGVQFVEQCVASSHEGGVWKPLAPA